MRLRLWDYSLKNKFTRRLYVRTKECVHCGKFIINTKYRFHLLIHSYEKPFQCGLCHLRFPDEPHLKAHLTLFHKNKNSGFDDSLGLHVSKALRKSSTKVVLSENSLPTGHNSPDLSTNSNWYRKEYISPTSAEDRARRYEARKAKLELGSATGQPLAQLKTNTPCRKVETIRRKNDFVDDFSISTSTITGIKILPGFLEAEAYTVDNGVVRCTRCSEVFYGLNLFKWHWSSEHKHSSSGAYRESLTVSNKANQAPKQTYQKELNVLELNHKKIISAQWSRKLKSKYKKLQGKKPVPASNPTNISKQTMPYSPLGKAGYGCPYCQKTFQIVYEFELHLAIHEKRKIHPCFFCPNEFLSQKHLETHLKALHRLTVA